MGKLLHGFDLFLQVTSSASAAVVQMQVQQVRSNISTTPSYGNPPIKLDSKQLTHLFAQHQHQIINKTKGQILTSF